MDAFLLSEVEHRRRLLLGLTPPSSDGEDDMFLERMGLSNPEAPPSPHIDDDLS